jgi:hypothetical protein
LIVGADIGKVEPDLNCILIIFDGGKITQPLIPSLAKRREKRCHPSL